MKSNINETREANIRKYVNVYHNPYDDKLLEHIAIETHHRVQKLVHDYDKKYTQDQKLEHLMDKSFMLYEFSKCLND